MQLINNPSSVLMMAMRQRGGERPGAGRKPMRPEERKRNRVLDLDDEDYSWLVDAAGDEAVSTYARDVLLRHLDRRKT